MVTERITLATYLTLARIVAAPFFVLLMMKGWYAIGFWCFVAAALTDACDGIIARMRNEQTMLGACLDPIADKLLLMTCFLTLAYVQTPLLPIPVWFAWLVVTKEVLLMGGVLLCYSRYGLVTMRPTMLSKMTTLLQCCFIGWLFVCYFFHWAPLKVYTAMVMIMVIMVLGCLAQYAYIGFTMRTRQ